MKAFEIKSIPGPVLVIGASGFIGANILRTMLRERDDVVGTIFSGQSWRLEGIPSYNVSFMNLQDPVSVHSLLGRYSPKTIFDCSSFGAYSFEQEFSRIHATNYISFINIMEILASYEIHAYIHAGSSSEYGTNSAGPSEDGPLVPNSHYAVSKAGVASAIAYYGKTRGLPVVNLRLYSIYGPYEDSSRLIPVLCENILRRSLPPFANPNISRDFVHAGDAVDAFFSAALRMNPRMFGESYNIGTGVETSLGGLARAGARSVRHRRGYKLRPSRNPRLGCGTLVRQHRKIRARDRLEIQHSPGGRPADDVRLVEGIPETRGIRQTDEEEPARKKQKLHLNHNSM